jgi:hypothetical protein
MPGRAGQARGAGALAPAAAVEACVRLKGDTTGRATYEWVRGAAHALPDDARSLPLFRFESVTVRRFLPQGSGRWREVNYACRLYRDHASGAVIDRMTNPLTGREAHSAHRSAVSGQTRRETSMDVFTVDARAFADRRATSLRADYHWNSVT